MLKYLYAYRNYHRKPGNYPYISQILEQSELFTQSPDEFVRLLKNEYLKYHDVPSDFIAGLFDDELNLQIKCNLDSDLLHATEWLVLSSIAIGMRKYLLAIQLRDKALERAMQYANLHNPLNLLRIDQIIGALIETLQFDRLKYYLGIAKILRTACGRTGFRNKLLAIIENQPPSSGKAVDLAFQKYMSGKSIAIVGPLSLSESEKKEAVSKDVVITLNDLSLFNGRAYPEVKPDVIYLYRGLQNEFVDKTTESDFQYIPEFLVYNLDKDYSPYLKERTRVRDDVNPYTFNGSLNFIPRVILDVLLHGGRDLKVYGTDMYTSLNYSSSYDGGRQDDWQYILKKFIVHDPITNYKFMHLLWSKGLYKADDRLEEVMNMGLNGYINYFK